MEEFFQENRDSYTKQVATFKPSQNPAKDAGGELGKEVEDGEVTGISVRPEAGYADVHELRRKINGQPTLNVRGFFPPLRL
jgi:kinesin family protein 2/24